jgi:putative (di)nucleoside polyphosphate hydrolase
MSKGENGYRRGVGVMLLNSEGKVFVGARIDNTDEAWQMPQGGIDDADHDEWGTALRELEEETGISPDLVVRISAASERLKYDLPDALKGKLWGGKYVGQDQDWFLARFIGQDKDINIATKHREFREWKWIYPAELPLLIVPFKRDLYRRLLSEFAEYL